MGKQYAFLGILLISLVYAGGAAWADSSSDLDREIQNKGQQLQEINSKIRATQSQISNLQGKGRTLKDALHKIGVQVDQVNLGIRSSEVKIDKLGLEIQSLNSDIEETNTEIYSKEAAISKILRQLQQKDRDGLLVTLLRYDSLADGLFEVQALSDLQDNLSVEAAALVKLEEKLEKNVAQTTEKKSDIEEEHQNLKSKKVILANQQQEKDQLLKETKNQESLYQKKLTELETQQRAIETEITQIEAQLRGKYKPSGLPSSKSAAFLWPVALTSDGGPGKISQNYGETAFSRFYKGNAHNGLDIAAPIGTPVYAAADGKVVRADDNGRYQYGKYILIDHGNGLTTLYAHLSGFAVSSGNVTKGQLIGYVGNTGFSTGSHVHFGLYATPSGGWQTSDSKEKPGLVSVPPAGGLVPIGVTVNPRNYL